MIVAEDEEERIQIHKSTVEHHKEKMMWWKLRVQCFPRKNEENTSRVGRGRATGKVAKGDIQKAQCRSFQVTRQDLPDE